MPGGPDRATLAGAEIDCRPDALRHLAIDRAFDYRGDVTMAIDDGRVVAGYLFDRRGDNGSLTLRVMLPDGGQERVEAGRVVRLAFDRRDPAAGKSWETWVQKYIEKKSAGEEASIH